MNRRAFFTSVLIAAGAVLPKCEVTTNHPCPVCGLPGVWAEVRSADVTGPADTSRIYVGLWNIYWHREGDRLTRCHRDRYMLVPVKGVVFRDDRRA